MLERRPKNIIHIFLIKVLRGSQYWAKNKYKIDEFVGGILDTYLRLLESLVNMSECQVTGAALKDSLIQSFRLKIEENHSNISDIMRRFVEFDSNLTRR